MDTEALPAVVRTYAERATRELGRAPRRVRITQSGTMCRSPGGPWKPFTAEQDFAADRTFFEWRARMPMLGPLAIRVVDRVEGGQGLLEGKLLGLRVVRAEGPDVDRGELMRYLAELPWNPGAIALHPGLRWEELEDGTVEVSCTEGALEATVRLCFDAAGDIERASAIRPRTEGSRTVPTRWWGRFFDHRSMGGLRIPTRAEVTWELPSGPYPYFRGEVTSLTTASA